MKTRVLLVDDDPAMCLMLETRLTARGFAVVSATSAAEALEFLERDHVDAVVTDINMKGVSGVELCRRVLSVRSTVPVIMMTAFGTMETAIAAMRVGAYDFLPKPFEIDQLVLSLERAVSFARLSEEVRRLRRAVADTQRFEDLLGGSPAMTQLYALLARVAGSDVPVLVTGESGTGKEVVARALHNRGPRSAGPFVAVNCAAMPEHLLESELFGHTRGAFTDARAAKEGLFVAARGGTIFLDEIGDMPLGLQPKLLRALQERAVRPVGSNSEVAFDARVIAATNRDLEALVDEHRFREDLFFRINVISVHVPPLRARAGDVLLLAQHFLDRVSARVNKGVSRFTAAAAEKMMTYSWPGNVRELQNCIERAVALASSEEVDLGDLPERVRAFQSKTLVVGSDNPEELVTLGELERRYVYRVLEATAGNKTTAARVLGVERRTLYRMLERWGEPESKRKL